MLFFLDQQVRLNPVTEVDQKIHFLFCFRFIQVYLLLDLLQNDELVQLPKKIYKRFLLELLSVDCLLLLNVYLVMLLKLLLKLKQNVLI